MTTTSFDPIDGRFSPTTDAIPPWYASDLAPHPLEGTQGIAGPVAMITLHGSVGGMTYEQTEPVGTRHHRVASSGPLPSVSRST